jgi:hypothetical protein
MEAVVGILNTKADAERTVERLRGFGIDDVRLNLLTPESPHADIADVPTTETEQPGMGAAMGGVVGGALGAAGGMTLGASVASLLVPGVGPVIAIGLAAAALLGAGGAAAGALAGQSLEESVDTGLPVDELFVYEHELRHGRSVLIVLAEGDPEADQVQAILREEGAESVDGARERWWVGLRDAEKEVYSHRYDNFDEQEEAYRRGFEAALHPSLRKMPFDKAADRVRHTHPDVYDSDSFRYGYDRGHEHYRRLTLERPSDNDRGVAARRRTQSTNE